MRVIKASCFYGIYISTIIFNEIIQNKKADYILAPFNIPKYYNEKMKQ